MVADKQKSSGSLKWIISAATLSRLVLNTGRRFAYPFAPALSRGLGVELTAVTSIIAISQSAGLAGAFFGPVADRFGYRNMMMTGLTLTFLAMAGAAFFPVYPMVGAALFVAILGKTIFDPAIQAYVSKRVPFERRGFVIGIMETAWAGTTLVSIPLLGLLMDKTGWRSCFFAMAAGCGVCMVLLYFLAPPVWRPGKTGPTSAPGIFLAWKTMIKTPAALGALGFVFLEAVANDNLFVVYGAWFESRFNLNLVAIGFGTGVIGLAELAGEFVSAFFSDRIGLKRSVIWGTGLSSLAYFMLPMAGQNLLGALAGMFILFFLFEVGMVSMLSLCTELLPSGRATMMASFFAAAGVGRILGALMGGPVWLAGGIAATATVSGVLTLAGVACLWWGLRKFKTGEKNPGMA